MRNVLFGFVAAVALAALAWYYWAGSQETAAASANSAGSGSGAAAGRGGRGRGAAMAVEAGTASRRELIDYITVVGNLIGEATVDVVPRVAGRLDSVQVQLGDRVSRGQQVAKVEDRELREQVNQSEANIQVNRATVTARENDLRVAESALERAKTSFERGLISKQGLEDAEARYNAAQSQLDVAKAQLTSTQARLDELKINLANTVLVAPMDGVVSKRNLDPGAFAGGNTVVLSLVDIGTVRLIANLVERDFKRVEQGGQALVEVDAFPGEQFRGRVSRVAPVFDPGTRTATMEIAIPNPGFRLKPGMYARVRLTADSKPNALAVPRNAVVDVGGRRGVYLLDGDVTVGALAVRDGERVSVIGAGARAGGRDGGSDATGRQSGAGASGRGRGQQQQQVPAGQ